MLIAVNKTDQKPLFRQIQEQIVDLIEDGVLRPGDRLPATRVLAEQLGVHRSTVVRAFDEIRALGYLESREGSYTRVRWRARFLERAREPSIDLGVKSHAAPSLTSDMHRPPTDGDVIDFERLSADPSLTPSQDLGRAIRKAFAQRGNAVLDYSDPAGWQPLREALAMRLRAHGIVVSPDEMLITHGAQHALDLVFRLFTHRGDRVAVEAPTYAMAHDLLRLHGLEPVEVPMTEHGMDLDHLDRALHKRKPRLLYTMPNFQNPTGITTDQTHRERLFDLCGSHGVPIVEDGFEEELRYGGPVALPIKSMDRSGQVIYIGTFSKVVFSGLRVGWIAAHPNLIRELTSIHHASCISGNTLAQAAVERYCLGGQFDAHLRKLHRIYRRRMQAILGGLEAHVPDTWGWTKPLGGYTLWLTKKEPSGDEQLLLAHLAQIRVKVAPGRLFFAQKPQSLHLRLSIATVDQSQIKEGCLKLGQALAVKS